MRAILQPYRISISERYLIVNHYPLRRCHHLHVLVKVSMLDILRFQFIKVICRVWILILLLIAYKRWYLLRCKDGICAKFLHNLQRSTGTRENLLGMQRNLNCQFVHFLFLSRVTYKEIWMLIMMIKLTIFARSNIILSNQNACLSS